MNDELEMLEEEYSLLSVVTLDEFIVYMQRLSELGYGDKQMYSYPSGGAPFPYYNENDGTLEL